MAETAESVAEAVDGDARRARWSAASASPASAIGGRAVSCRSRVRQRLRPLVDQAIAHWHANTRIRLVERTAANAAQFPNWVSFEQRDGCWSSVGMQGGARR